MNMKGAIAPDYASILGMVTFSNVSSYLHPAKISCKVSFSQYNEGKEQLHVYFMNS